MTTEWDIIRPRVSQLIHRYNNAMSLLRITKPDAMKYDRVKRKCDLLHARIGMLYYSVQVGF